MTESAKIFDRSLLRKRRDRAAAVLSEHDFLFREVAARLADRLEDVTRAFPNILDLGCRTGFLAPHLGQKGGVESLVHCELSPVMAAAVQSLGHPVVVGDGECLPFAQASFDLVISALDLHWVNDLPGTLLQINRILKPDGLFLAAFFGGATLHQLRDALMQGELETTGGARPRVSPFVDLRDAGALLQRAGFALPVADLDSIEVHFSSPLALMADLRGMGESHAGRERPEGLTRRAVLRRAAQIYQEKHGLPDGRVPATFEVIYLTAWAPHRSQPQPLRPGSARGRLADALETSEIPTDDKAGFKKT